MTNLQKLKQEISEMDAEEMANWILKIKNEDECPYCNLIDSNYCLESDCVESVKEYLNFEAARQKAKLVMEMPENCDDCNLKQLIGKHAVDWVCTGVKDGYLKLYNNVNDEKPEWCPLIPCESEDDT